MSFALKVDPKLLRDAAAETSARISAVESCFGGIRSLISESAGYWRGSSGERTREEFEAQRENFEQVLSRFREYPPKLLEMAGLYTEAEDSNTRLNRTLDHESIP